VVYQNAFWLSYYHAVSHTTSCLIWNLQYIKSLSVYKHSANKSIFKMHTVTACHWTTSRRNNETVSFPLRRKHLIITIVPVDDMGILVSWNVTFRLPDTRDFYTVFSMKKKCLMIWKIQFPPFYFDVSFSSSYSLTHSPCFSYNVRDLVLNPYRTASRIKGSVHFNLYCCG
jgi:hypothetical protein